MDLCQVQLVVQFHSEQYCWSLENEFQTVSALSSDCLVNAINLLPTLYIDLADWHWQVFPILAWSLGHLLLFQNSLISCLFNSIHDLTHKLLQSHLYQLLTRTRHAFSTVLVVWVQIAAALENAVSVVVRCISLVVSEFTMTSTKAFHIQRDAFLRPILRVAQSSKGKLALIWLLLLHAACT